MRGDICPRAFAFRPASPGLSLRPRFLHRLSGWLSLRSIYQNLPLPASPSALFKGEQMCYDRGRKGGGAMDRIILHCDLNSFFASVELLDQMFTYSCLSCSELGSFWGMPKTR